MNNRLQQGHASAYALLNNLSFCVIDLETTGGDHLKDKIIEIGIVKVENLHITSQLSFLVRPEIPIPEFIQKLTSIQEEDLKKSPIIEEVIDKIVAFIGQSILVAHNASFDIPFLNSVLKRLSRPSLSNPTICTNLMTKYLIPELLNSNLSYIGELFGIEHKKAHRALEDARVTANLLLHYLHFFIEKDIKKINHLYYPRRKYELNSAHFTNSEEENYKVINQLAITETPIVLIFKGSEGTIEATIPLYNPKSQIQAIKNFIVVCDWKVVTLKMVGEFLEGLFMLGEFFTHFSSERKEQILEFLYQNNPELKDLKGIKQSGEVPCYLIIRHLIPEQYRIYSLDSIGIRGQMIFRYPLHHKKLLLFLNHQSRATKPKGRAAIDEKLNSFIWQYIELQQIKRHTPFLIFTNRDALNVSLLKKRVQDFITATPHHYLYPRQHI